MEQRDDAGGRSQVNVILLPYSLGHQFAFTDAQCFLAAHHLTLPVLGHLDGEGGVHNPVATQHLTCRKRCMKHLKKKEIALLH